MFDIRENLKNLPDKPGVYLHKDKDGQIIYVGKAISLKNRVRQYFQSSSKMDPKVRAMVSHIAEFEYIVTETEMEALILENSLIKKYMPKYNVLLRDDKTFPYIKVTLQEEWPRLIKTRRVLKDKAMYFGPYTDVASMTEIIDLLSSIYQLKRCSTHSFPEGFRPCLHYHLGECRGICKGETDPAHYRRDLEQVMDFLKGNTKGVIEDLSQKMEFEAEAMNYERAALYRDLITTVSAIPDQEKLDGFLQNVKRNRVKVVRRKAEELAKKEQERNRVLEDSWISIGLEGVNRLEAYDISHIAGTDAVGAMVVFQNGSPQRKAYRRFRIKTAPGGGDTDSLQEVLYRRLRRGVQQDPGFVPLPDLLLIDGGTNQVAAAEKVVKAMGLSIHVSGMVKDEKHRTRGFLYRKLEYDRSTHRALLNYIGIIQEEVHRFAIEYHRGLRAKKLKKSVLDEIPGIGERRKQLLFETFGSIEGIVAAGVDGISSLAGMNQGIAEKVMEHLNNSIVKNE